MRDKDFWRLMGAILTVVGCGIYWGRGACVSEQVAIDAMTAEGFTEPHVTSSSVWAADLNGCDEKDAVAFQVTAKRDGKPVRAVVCSGYPFKGATVRFQH